MLAGEYAWFLEPVVKIGFLDMALAVTIPETSNSVPGWRTSFQPVKSKPTLLQTHRCLSHLRCDSVCIALALVTAVLAHTEIVAHIKKSPPSRKTKSSSRIYNQNDNCNYIKSSIKFTSRSRKFLEAKLRRRMKKRIWLKCSWMQNSQALVYNYTAVDIYIKRERESVTFLSVWSADFFVLLYPTEYPV